MQKNINELPPVLKMKEVEELLGVTRFTVTRWVNAGILPKRKIGLGRGIIRFLLSDVLKLLNSREAA